MAEKPLTHAQVWDDSYLQDSWNEALEEYNKYHSLAARGLSGTALIEELKQNGQIITEEKIEKHVGDTLHKADQEATKIEEDEYEPGEVMDEALHGAAAQRADVSDKVMEEKATRQPNGTAPLPGVAQHLSAHVQEESVRNLMMSWYYAGYYTGLHEGQQKAMADLSTPQQT